MRRVTTATLLATAFLVAPIAFVPNAPARAQIGIGISFNVTIAPPALPIYEAPPIPAPGYIFTPGYWAYGDAGYYWVPGVWVQPPTVGVLWTPGYWGWSSGRYIFNAGYWGPHVGFYGGINYGFGYTSNGYFGGEWHGRDFAYNESAFHPGFFHGGGVHVTNVYNRTIVNNTTINRVSFNGPNGIQARPNPEEERYLHEQHVQATAMQQQHFQAAAHDRTLLASVNQGHPAIAAVARPAVFHGPGVVAAHEAAMHPALPVVQHPSSEGHPPLQPHQGAMRPGAISHEGTPERAGVPERAAGGGYHPQVQHAEPAHAAPMQHPEGMGRPMMAPHPMAAPHQAAPAPHAGGGHEPPKH
jgi:hypothetical protein